LEFKQLQYQQLDKLLVLSLTNVESWDGTSWTEVAEVNTAVADAGQAGLSTSGIKFGGATAGGVTGATEFYNGTTWTELSDLATATKYWGKFRNFRLCFTCRGIFRRISFNSRRMERT
jgi:hypothetical protein